MLPQFAGGGEAYRKEGLDELGEKFLALALIVDLDRGFAGADDVVQLQPAGKKLVANMLEKHPMIAGLGRDQKRCAFRRERVAAAIAGEQPKRDQKVGDGCETADRGAAFVGELFNRARPLIEEIKNTMAHCCLDGQGRRVTPGKLHDSFRCESFGFVHNLERF